MLVEKPSKPPTKPHRGEILVDLCKIATPVNISLRWSLFLEISMYYYQHYAPLELKYSHFVLKHFNNSNINNSTK
jgi:hypothetical protein